MNFINPNVFINGSYISLQTRSAEGLLEFPDEFLPEFFKEGKRSAGFVDITDDGRKVLTCVWNEEAYQKWLSQQPDPMNALRSAKEAELSAACKAAIEAGMDVETTQGTEHFDLTEEDQINLSTALGKVDAGATAHPYHSKRSLCRMFTADEIRAVSNAAVAHALYQQTLCNHLMTWARRAETEDELNGITYTAEGLPDDLAANMAQVLEAAQNV